METQEGGTITGIDGKDSIYVVLWGKRLNGHYDLWFTESKTGGTTWLPFIRVPRPNMEDTCDRSRPSLIVVSENERLYIVYHQVCDGKYQVSFVTRAPKSQIFSLENTVAESWPLNINIMSPKSAYTVKQGQTVVHVFWGNASNTCYVLSSNNGVAWTEPQVIAEDENAEHHLALAFAPSVNTGIFLMLYTGDRTSRLIYTYDHGQTFHRVVFDTPNIVFSPVSMELCSGAGSPYLVAFIPIAKDTRGMHVDYLNVELANMTVTRPAHPFHDQYYGYALACRESTGTAVMGSSSTLVAAQNVKTLLPREMNVLSS